MRSRLKRLEHAAEGRYFVTIPQWDGPPKRFSHAEIREAFSVSVKRLCGEDLPEHPVSTAAANSPDPDWYRCFVAGTHTVTGGELPEDLSE
jgi:hypothetical protein